MESSRQAAPAAARPAGDDAERAASAALASLRRHALPDEPQYLAVWYAYHRGLDPALRQAMDARLRDGQPVSPLILADLHRRLLAGEVPGLPENRGKVQAAADSLLALTANAGEQMADFGRILEEVGTGLALLEGAELRQLAAGLVTLTRGLTARTEQVSHRLAETERSVTELRRQLAALNQAALTDSLTGIGNRRAFDADLEAMLGEPRTQRRPPTLLLLDIDHFKRVNDTWGHPVGDALLRFVGLQLRTGVRPTDRSYRIGGEEFAILLPGTPVAEALVVAERVRRAVADHDFKLRTSGERIGRVTLSGGAATHGPGETGEDLFARADAALYAAKAAGRDRVLVATPRGSPAAPPT